MDEDEQIDKGARVMFYNRCRELIENWRPS